MSKVNSRIRYTWVAIILHWSSALLIIGLLALGAAMVRMEPGSGLQFDLYQLHKSLGITVLALSIVRVLWRLGHRPPALATTLQPWEKALAQATHAGFYVLILALPLTGWMVVSASVWNIPTVLYGIIPLPHLPILPDLADKKPVEDALKEVHEWLAITVTGLLALHVAGALKHHFVLGDDTLARMLPWLHSGGAPADVQAPSR